MISRISAIAFRRTATSFVGSTGIRAFGTADHSSHARYNSPCQLISAKRTFFQASAAMMPVKIIEVR